MTIAEEAGAGIFICYRRADTRADAGRLYDRLAAHFGEQRVFIDVDDIGPGQDFREVLTKTLNTSFALLVLVGPTWRGNGGEENDRLSDENDFVRLEIRTALEQGLAVIPVLFNGAGMPSTEALPDDIGPLADRQALEVSDLRFHDDISILVGILETLLPDGTDPKHRHRTGVGWYAGVAVVLALVLILWWTPSERSLDDSGERIETPLDVALVLRHEPLRVSRAALLQSLLRLDLFDAALNPAGRGSTQDYELSTVGDDAVVQASYSGIMWQNSAFGKQMQRGATEEYLRLLNQQKFGGHSDWRLPTFEEAASLLAPEKQNDTYLHPVLQPKRSPVIWTADSAGEDSFWVLYSYDGRFQPEAGVFNAWVRAVRSLD